MQKTTIFIIIVSSVLLGAAIALAIALPLLLINNSTTTVSTTVATTTHSQNILDRYSCSLVDHSTAWNSAFSNTSSDAYKKFAHDLESSIDVGLTVAMQNYSVTVSVILISPTFNKTGVNETSIDLIVSFYHSHGFAEPSEGQLKTDIGSVNAKWTVQTVKKLEASCSHGWNYDINGPTEWPSFCASCNGLRQSPIQIYSEDVVMDTRLRPLQFINYDANFAGITVEDNGHTAYVSIPTSSPPISLKISRNQTKEYKLQQIHFHWGFNDYEGSEHSVSNAKFPVEIHLVHRYSDTDLAVLAVFGEVSCDNESGLLQTISDELTKVALTGEKATIPGLFSINQFLPTTTDSFFTYSGSLTTPPCSEIVEWTILADTIKINQKTIDQLRKLRDSLTRPLTQNYRNPQSLNNRQIKFRGTSIPDYARVTVIPQCE